MKLFVGIAATSVLLLAGCAASPQVSQPTRSVAPSATADAPTIGTGQFPTVDLPATFPSDVPLVDGQVVFALDLATGWSLVKVEADPAAAYTQAAAQLTAAGFAKTTESITQGVGTFAEYDNDKYVVQLVATKNETYGQSISYSVIRKG